MDVDYALVNLYPVSDAKNRYSTMEKMHEINEQISIMMQVLWRLLLELKWCTTYQGLPTAYASAMYSNQ